MELTNAMRSEVLIQALPYIHRKGDKYYSDLKEINNIIRSHNTVGRQSEMNR